MKKLIVAFALFASGLSVGVLLERKEQAAVAQAGPPTCTNESGDVNGSGKVDLTDAVYILNYLFLGSGLKPLPFCTPAKGSALPATGQTKCYDGDQVGAEIDCASATNPGQDGFYQTGCPPEGRFVDNGDGTVSDKCTGLMWQKDTADVNADGQTPDDLSDALPWYKALAYCENLSFAGHDDWRLPNVRELQSIVDYGRVNPSIDPVFRALSNIYLSSTSVADAPRAAWYVYFNEGQVEAGAGLKTNFFYVRAVRSGP